METKKLNKLIYEIENLNDFEQINISKYDHPKDDKLIYTIADMLSNYDYYEDDLILNLNIHEIKEKLKHLDINYYWFGALDDCNESYKL